MTTQAELEAAIDRAPDDPAGYLVLADWLQQQGDPRGQLIALQHAGKTAEADALIDEHVAAFWGPLAEARDLTRRFEFDPIGAPTTWRWGYLESLWISNKFERSEDHDGSLPTVEVDELLGAMLDHPSAHLLRKLAVGIVSYQDNDYSSTIRRIAARERPHLRTLVLGDFYYEETELNWSSIGDLAPLYAAVPDLRSLTLRSGRRIDVGAISLPKLESLVIVSGGIDRGSATAIASADWPALHTLMLELGNEGGGNADLSVLLSAARVPKLRYLGLGNSTNSDEHAIQLASSPLAAQLETLEFTDATLGDEGAAALVEAKARFTALQSIDITNCYLTEAGVASLRTLCEVFGGEHQREDGGDPDDRYINAHE